MHNLTEVSNVHIAIAICKAKQWRKHMYYHEICEGLPLTIFTNEDV